MNMKQDTDGLKVTVQFESRLLEIAEKRAGDRCESLSDYINRLVFLDNCCQQMPTRSKASKPEISCGSGQNSRGRVLHPS